jgi:protocatechuate 3,4-dioxygenase beta subunit
MERKEFLKNSLLAFGALVTVPTVLTSCKKDEDIAQPVVDVSGCPVSPPEIKGPFPIMTPSQLVQANITSDRVGVALLINLTIQNKNNNCSAAPGLSVDVWHCDNEGNYSEYGGNSQQATNYSGVHFLRGRQTTDINGNVSFISLYPGWYPGRAPHIHVEILDNAGNSLLVTQVAFPEEVSSTVYSTSQYTAHGQADTVNTSDGIFLNSLNRELATVTGDVTNGYTLTKTITVAA